MMKVLVIIPVYNEEMNIGKVIEEVKTDLDFVDILVVNDCSTDGTLSVIEKIQGINYISLPVNLGYSGALQTGFKYAVNNNYEAVIQFDGDGQHIASEALRLYKIFLDTQSDIVIGSRFKTDKLEYHHSFFRGLGTKIFQTLIKKFCKVSITDPTSGFQILSKDVFEIYSKMNNYPEFPDANLLIEMLFKGYKVEEEYVRMRNREFGESMHGGLIKPMKYMIVMIYSIIILLTRRKEFSRNTIGKGLA